MFFLFEISDRKVKTRHGVNYFFLLSLVSGNFDGR